MRPPRCYPSLKRTDRPRTILEYVSKLSCQSYSHISSLRSCHTFRISLFLTLQICWMSAADWETFSRELPLNCSSSFWFFDISTSTPGCITTLRTIFSPMKFLYIPSAFVLHFCLKAHPKSSIKTPRPPPHSIYIAHTGFQPHTAQSRSSYQH